MNPTPYIIFQGHCREAMTAYAAIFGGEITMMMTGSEMPEMEVPDHMADWIMHSELTFDGGTLMASDDMMGSNPAMAGASVMMEFDSVDEAKSAYDELTKGGSVIMPFAATPWAEGFAMLTDRFGTSWMLSGPASME
ncbi:MAG: VOC family protein [Pseudomonadota bacterium]